MTSRVASTIVVALALAGCASQNVVPLPEGVAIDRDLRGTYRASLCARPAMAGEACADVLRTYEGEVAAARPPRADPAKYRLLFVPGFLASCFPGIHSFADVIEAAREAGYAADALAVGGRNGVAANGELVAQQVERIAGADARRIILVGHSKGADDILDALARHPALSSRVDAVLAIAGALEGSPLAEDLHGLYGATLAWMPFTGCERGQGDPVADLTADARAQWWTRNGAALATPVYAIVTRPDFSRLGFSLWGPYARLSALTPDNDGMLRSRDQVARRAMLLGVVNADHLSVAIPHPGLMYLLVFNPTPFPRADVYLAAIDVIASQSP
ncbi:MAG: hypothetical protein U1F54_18250 [Burkholderiales bacterium]